MLNVLAPVALGLLAVIFHSAERSLSLFSWSQLEALDINRSQRERTEFYLDQRQLVITSLATVGCLATAGMAAFLIMLAYQVWHAWLLIGLLALTVIWLIPEMIAWRFRTAVVIYLVPVLYVLVGKPFGAVRRLFIKPVAGAGMDRTDTPAEAPDETPGAGADAAAREVFRMAVRLEHLQVREIMTPRTAMISVADTVTPRLAAQVSTESGYSRIPVYRGSRDLIIGVLHAKDLLPFATTEKWDRPISADMLRQPFFVPETKTVSELLAELQRASIHMGIVLDEYGGTTGIVTLEDVVEELIGEIRDEYESPEEEQPLYKWLDKRTAEVLAVMHIDEFNERFHLDLPEEDDFDTIAGFVTYKLGKIPLKGESFAHDGARFTVIEADPRRVIRVKVELEEERG